MYIQAKQNKIKNNYSAEFKWLCQDAVGVYYLFCPGSLVSLALAGWYDMLDRDPLKKKLHIKFKVLRTYNFSLHC